MVRITMAVIAACCFLLNSNCLAQDKSLPEQKPTQTINEQLKRYVKKLAIDFGERNLTHLDSLNQSADWIEKTLLSFGYKVSRQTFTVNNIDCHNIIAEKTGTKHPQEIVIVGAHYDSAANTPGANDNGSGTASMLALADLFKKEKPDRTIRFIAFTNEEPPYFQTENQMGSWVYARQCRKNQENIVGAISLETMGYFTDKENSQKYPPLISALYPSTGNFIGFVGDAQSREFTRRCFRVFKKNSNVPAEVASLSGSLPGVGWSDHWSFWQEGYAGVMVTDTAPFRYPHYHKSTDTPDKIKFATLAKVVKGLQAVVNNLIHVDEDK